MVVEFLYPATNISNKDLYCAMSIKSQNFNSMQERLEVGTRTLNTFYSSYPTKLVTNQKKFNYLSYRWVFYIQLYNN